MLVKTTLVLVSLLVSGLAKAIDSTDTGPEALAPRLESDLEADVRPDKLVECPKGNGCKCSRVPAGDQYCGLCAEVTDYGRGGDWSHVYECNKSGGCCDYGVASDCKAKKNMRCGTRKVTVSSGGGHCGSVGVGADDSIPIC